jgi:hypothetical protein
MSEIFPGAPVAIIAQSATMEGAKLAHTVASIDTQIGQIDSVGGQATEEERAQPSPWAISSARSGTDFVAVRQREASALVELPIDRAKLEGGRGRGLDGRYLACMAGVESETAVRWLTPLMVLRCEPAAIALTAAGLR